MAPITIIKVPSHRTAEDFAQLGLPMTAFWANRAADLLAGSIAAQAQVEDEVVYQVAALELKA
eukprot:10490442-Prorocentrum_lima.AAC.1